MEIVVTSFNYAHEDNTLGDDRTTRRKEAGSWMISKEQNHLLTQDIYLPPSYYMKKNFLFF